MKIKLEPIPPDRRIKRVTAPTVSFAETGLVRLSVQAVKNTGLKAGQYVGIYRDDKNNLYIGEGKDFELRSIKHNTSTTPGLGFSNVNWVRNMAKEMDWPLGNGKMTHISYDLLPEPICVDGINVWKLV